MNLLDWAQIALSLVVMLAGLYLSRPRGRGVPVTTRVVGFGVSLLSLSYLVGGLRIPLSEGPLLDGVEAYSALVGVLVVRGALMQASPASPRAPKKTVPGSLKRTEGGEPGFF